MAIEFNESPFDENRNYSIEEIYNQIGKTCTELTNHHFPKQKYCGFRSCPCMPQSGLNGKEANEFHRTAVEIYIMCAIEIDKLIAKTYPEETKLGGLEKKAE